MGRSLYERPGPKISSSGLDFARDLRRGAGPGNIPGPNGPLSSCGSPPRLNSRRRDVEVGLRKKIQLHSLRTSSRGSGKVVNLLDYTPNDSLESVAFCVLPLLEVSS